MLRRDETRREDSNGVGYGKRNNTNENSIERRLVQEHAHIHQPHVTSRHTKSNSFCEIAIYSKSFSSHYFFNNNDDVHFYSHLSLFFHEHEHRLKCVIKKPIDDEYANYIVFCIPGMILAH